MMMEGYGPVMRLEQGLAPVQTTTTELTLTQEQIFSTLLKHLDKDKGRNFWPAFSLTVDDVTREAIRDAKTSRTPEDLIVLSRGLFQLSQESPYIPCYIENARLLVEEAIKLGLCPEKVAEAYKLQGEIGDRIDIDAY